MQTLVDAADGRKETRIAPIHNERLQGRLDKATKKYLTTGNGASEIR
jgi:hypothetical protein